MWNLKRNDTNENRKRLTDLEKGLNICRGKDEGKRHGVWDEHVHTAIFKIGSQQGPTA